MEKQVEILNFEEGFSEAMKSLTFLPDDESKKDFLIKLINVLSMPIL